MTKYNEVPDLQKQLAELERRMLEMETSQRFTSLSLANGTSINVKSGGTISVSDGGALAVNAESLVLVNEGAAVEVSGGGDINLLSGAELSGAFGSEINSAGALNVSGTLTLPPGIIDNQALASPITVTVVETMTRNSWPVTTAFQTRATSSVIVPGGFSQALVIGMASIVFQDTQPNSFQSRVVINNTEIGSQLSSASAVTGTMTVMHTAHLVGVNGSFNVDLQIKATAASSDTDGRSAQLSGLAVFFR